MLGKHKYISFVTQAGIFYNFCDFFKLSLIFRDDSIDNSVSINRLAFEIPIDVNGDLRARNELKRKEPRHLMVVIVTSWIHVVIKVRAIKNIFCGDLSGLGFYLIVNLLLDINAGCLLKTEIVIAPLNIDYELLFNQVRDSLFYLTQFISSRVDTNDLFFSRIQTFKLSEDIDQGDRLNNLTTKCILGNLIKNRTCENKGVVDIARIYFFF